MRILCLQLPHIGAHLAVRSRPALAGRAVVLIEGHGDDAVVSDRTCEAGARGILVGLSAGQARGLCPGAVFLADNAGACLDELERLATILRTRATTLVAIGGRDHLFIDITDDVAEQRIAARLSGLVSAWADYPVRAGVASSRAAACEAASASRRAPVIVPPDGDEEEPGLGPYRDEPLTGEWRVAHALSGLQARARTVRLLAHLDTMLAAQARSFREATVSLETAEGISEFHFRVAPSHAASDLLSELAARLGADGLDGALGLSVALQHLGPDVRIRPLPAQRFAARQGAAGPALQRTG